MKSDYFSLFYFYNNLGGRFSLFFFLLTHSYYQQILISNLIKIYSEYVNFCNASRRNFFKKIEYNKKKKFLFFSFALSLSQS
jgi:hypothetical protein